MEELLCEHLECRLRDRGYAYTKNDTLLRHVRTCPHTCGMTCVCCRVLRNRKNAKKRKKGILECPHIACHSEPFKTWKDLKYHLSTVVHACKTKRKWGPCLECRAVRRLFKREMKEDERFLEEASTKIEEEERVRSPEPPAEEDTTSRRDMLVCLEEFDGCVRLFSIDEYEEVLQRGQNMSEQYEPVVLPIETYEERDLMGIPNLFFEASEYE